MQILCHEHRPFMREARRDISALRFEVFLSIRIYAYVIFYKYYLGQRDPKKQSDFGDLGHLCYIPYCDLAVMERDLCNVLNQIKGNHDVLSSTVVKNIDFLDEWQF